MWVVCSWKQLKVCDATERCFESLKTADGLRAMVTTRVGTGDTRCGACGATTENTGTYIGTGSCGGSCAARGSGTSILCGESFRIRWRGGLPGVPCGYLHRMGERRALEADVQGRWDRQARLRGLPRPCGEPRSRPERHIQVIPL